MNSKKLVLVDGSWYLYRAFYAVEKQGLTNSKGFPTGAILVVTRMMEKLREQHKPDFFGVVFDPAIVWKILGKLLLRGKGSLTV